MVSKIFMIAIAWRSLLRNGARVSRQLSFIQKKTKIELVILLEHF